MFAALRLSRTHCEDRGRKKNLTGVSLWFARAIADMHQLTHPTFPSDLKDYGRAVGDFG